MRYEAVILPDLGTGPDVPIIISYWFASRGEHVWEGERLVEILAGPATFDVPAPADGLDDGSGEPSDRDGAGPQPRRTPSGGVDCNHDMTTFHERSAGVIPYRRSDEQGPL